jgi:hypothetical protein
MADEMSGESSTGDTHHVVGNPPQLEPLCEDIRRASEPSIPEPIADDGDWRRTWCPVVRLDEGSPERDVHTHHVEVVCRYQADANLACCPAAPERRIKWKHVRAGGHIEENIR